jgi:pimeloyl-ACP methyl ester carboxylesterase
MAPVNQRSPSRVSRLLPTAAALLASWAAACGSSADVSQVPSAGREVEVVQQGQGDTTVVFESGLGNDWTPWQQVASEVAERAPTFAYSRPGYGQSEPSPEPRDATHIVAELRALLASRGVEPPFVLVGHSFGGAYMELFAKAYPEEVSGLVLVDPRHRDFTAACERAALEGCTPPAELVASLPEVQRAELLGFAGSAAAIAPLGSFGPYPVRVLTATSHGFVPEAEALWASLLGELAGEADDGEQRIFDQAGHYLQLERAHEVAEVILGLLPAVEH